MRKIKILFLKLIFILTVVTLLSLWFFNSDFGNEYNGVKNFKTSTAKEAMDYKNTQQQVFESYLDEKTNFAWSSFKDKFQNLKEHKLESPLPQNVKPNDSNTTIAINNPGVSDNVSDNSKKTSVDNKIDKATKDQEISDNSINTTKTENLQDFAPLAIDFYYDPSQEPSNITKEKLLENLRKVSDSWQRACNITFNYKGDRFSDYINTDNTLGTSEGLVRWGNLPKNAVGQAHQGNTQGYAKGFVLTLSPSFFNGNKDQNLLYTTILHETGHVIGLPHSNNPNSIMFWEQSKRKQVLNNTDIALCKYFRSRWEGLSAKEASDKYGILVNESSAQNEVSDSNE